MGPETNVAKRLDQVSSSAVLVVEQALREAKRLRLEALLAAEQSHRAMTAATQHKCDQMIAAARQEADSIVEMARCQAERILAEAEAEVSQAGPDDGASSPREMLEMALAESNSLLMIAAEEAQVLRDNLIADAEASAAEIVRQAELRSTEMTADARISLEAAREQVRQVYERLTFAARQLHAQESRALVAPQTESSAAVNAYEAPVAGNGWGPQPMEQGGESYHLLVAAVEESPNGGYYVDHPSVAEGAPEGIVEAEMFYGPADAQPWQPSTPLPVDYAVPGPEQSEESAAAGYMAEVSDYACPDEATAAAQYAEEQMEGPADDDAIEQAPAADGGTPDERAWQVAEGSYPPEDGQAATQGHYTDYRFTEEQEPAGPYGAASASPSTDEPTNRHYGSHVVFPVDRPSYPQAGEEVRETGSSEDEPAGNRVFAAQQRPRAGQIGHMGIRNLLRRQASTRQEDEAASRLYDLRDQLRSRTQESAP